MRPRILCPNCGSDVEHLAHCGVCGHQLPPMAGGDTEAGSSRFAWLQRLRHLRHIPSYRIVLVVGLLLTLIALLSDQAGLAIAVAVIIVPALAVTYLTGIDIYEREPWTILLGVVGAGAIVGLLAGWLSTLAFDQLWFDTSAFNLGAGGYAGGAADGQGSAPISVMLINGVLIPVLAAIATLAGPVSLRRSAVFRNEVMDGITLGAAAGGGFAITTAFVYFWPVFFDTVPERSVSEWTAALTGMVVLRPLIFAFSCGLLGEAIWSYVQTQRSRDLAWPLAAGMLGWLGTAIGTLLLIPHGTGWELLWSALVLLAAFVLFREAVRRGLALDRRVLVGAGTGERVVCPNCGRVTPDGTYCAFCGAELHADEVPAIAAREAPRSAVVTTTVIEAPDTGPSTTPTQPTERADEGTTRDPGQHDTSAFPEEDELAYPAATGSGEDLGADTTRAETIEPVAPAEPQPLTPPAAWYDLGRDDLPDVAPGASDEPGRSPTQPTAGTTPTDDRRPESEQADAWQSLDIGSAEPLDKPAEEPPSATSASDRTEADAADRPTRRPDTSDPSG